MKYEASPADTWKLPVLLFPFVTAAVAINLFLAFLMFHSLGVRSLSPLAALGWSLPLGLPATWAAVKWVRHLIDVADGSKQG